MRKNRIKPRESRVSYHCSSEAAQQLPLFHEGFAREWIYCWIKKLSCVYYVDLHAICVLPDRYRMVFTLRRPKIDVKDLEKRHRRYEALRSGPPRPWLPDSIEIWHERLTDLSCFMKDLNQGIAAYINQVNGNRGAVFASRFRSCVLEPGMALFACMASLELDPVREGLAERPDVYRFSSVGRFVQGGRKAAGVTMPKCVGFRQITSRAKQRAFADTVCYLDSRSRGVPDLASEDILVKLIAPRHHRALFELLFRRTRWVLNSMVLGRQAYCARILERGTKHNTGPPRPLHGITAGVFSNHVRAGPYLT